MAASQQMENFSSFTYVQKFGCLLFVFQIFFGLLVNKVVLANFCKGFGSGRCNCTVEFVECHGEHFIDNNIVKLYPYIKDYVENIIITGSNFTDLSKNVFGSCRHETTLVLEQLKYLDLSNNNVRTIHGKTFHCMPHLKTLILAHNSWELGKSNSSGFFSSLPQLTCLDLTNAFSFEDVSDRFSTLSKLKDVFNTTYLIHTEYLSLSQNGFSSFGYHIASSLCTMTALKSLNLSGNFLEKPSLDPCMQSLVTLDLSNNSMTVLGKNLQNMLECLPNLRIVRLDRNPYKCDCNLIDTRRWLRRTHVPVAKFDLRCGSAYNSSYVGRPILSLSESDLKCHVKTGGKTRPNTSVSSSGKLALILGLIFGVIGCALLMFLAINRSRIYGWATNCKKDVSRPQDGYSRISDISIVEKLSEKLKTDHGYY